MSSHGYKGIKTQEECGYFGMCLFWSGNKRKWSKISKMWMGNKLHKEAQEHFRRWFQGLEVTDAQNSSRILKSKLQHMVAWIWYYNSENDDLPNTIEEWENDFNEDF